MSMKDSACNGYVLPAIQFLGMLKEIAQRTLDSGEMLRKVLGIEAALEDFDNPDSDDLCKELGPLATSVHLPAPTCLYCLSDEDTSDDLERGVVYVVFDEDDLFERAPTMSMKLLRASENEPLPANWCVWG